MIGAGDLKDRLRFEKRGPDENGDLLGPWDSAGGVTRWARMQFLQGGEGVLQQRLAGTQPVIITVRDDSGTRPIDNSYRAVGIQTGRNFGKTYELREAHPNKESSAFIDILAVEVKGDDD